eukprot:TRINITY_DN36362_c0_g1_i1.p1 TRINITY_DN36362_c0_g1~~TRINITY_DN36362_c0_g1_i1.p1  ORF type:complete len:159 (-),score=11.65 TRINITY_DN36362_c0_g1_i1:136-612(-)
MECEEGVILLTEKPSEEFEPTEEEVRNYAEWLGIDPDADSDILYLAREGLKAPLQDGWKPCQNAEGEIFYFNFETGTSSWDHPADETYRIMVQDKKREKLEASGTRGKVPVIHAPYHKRGQGSHDGKPRVSCIRRWFCCCCSRRRAATESTPLPRTMR